MARRPDQTKEEGVKMRTGKVTLLGGAALAAALMSAGSAAKAAPNVDGEAQDSGSTSDRTVKAGDSLEIIVTARRREESVLEVPASIEVFDSKAIQGLGISNVQDVVRLTPGLYAPPKSSILNTTSINIRGIGSDISSPSTAIYVNDTPIQVRSIGDAQAADSVYPMIFDLERVEVLRGPQGTLFGSSAQGGAVRFITRQPGREWGGHALAEVSHVANGGIGYQAGFAGGGPLTDSIGFRGSLYIQRIPGWVDLRPLTNNLIGEDVFSDKDNINSADNVAAMATLAFKPADNITITPSIMWQKQESNGQGRHWRSFSSKGNYINRDLFPARVDNEFVLASVTAQIELNSLDIYSTTSYLDRTRDSVADLSFGFNGFFGGDITTPVTSITFSMQNPQKQFSQELRFQGVTLDDRLNWVVGGFYRNLKQKAEFTEFMPRFDDLLIEYFGFPTSVIFGSDLINGEIAVLQNDRSQDTELAGFGQLDFEVVPQWTLTAGLRFVNSKNEASIVRQGPLQATPGILTLSTSSSQSIWLPKVGLKYEPNDDLMFYANASRGFRPGGGNTTPSFGLCADGLVALGLTDVPSSYDADYLDSYELGFKGKSSDGRYLLVASVYHSKWKDIQDSVSLGTCGLRYIDNLGAAVSQGVEIQFAGFVTDNLKLGLSGAYNDAHFKDTIVIGAVPVVNAGDKLDTPPWMISGTIDYSFPVFAGKEGYLHFDGQYASGHNVRISPAEELTYPEARRRAGSIIANARIGLKMGALDVSLFADNLFDTNVVLRSSQVAGESIDEIPTPRTIGLTARSQF